MVQFLLSLPNGDMTALDLSGNTALHLAIGKGRKIKINTIPLLKAFLQTKTFNINVQDSDGNTVLHLAVLKKNSSVAEFLLTRPDLDINAKNFEGLTALHMAVRAGEIDTVRALLKKPGIDIHVADENHKTILAFAIESGNKSMLQYIIDVTINQSTQETLLHESIKLGNIDFVRCLLDHGANPNLLVFCNTLELLTTISEPQKRTIEEIFYQRYGGIPKHIPEFSLLDLSVFYGNAQIVKLLLDHPASIPQEHLKRALEYAQALGEDDIATEIQSRIPSSSTYELLERLTLPSATRLSKRKRANAEDEQQNSVQSKEKTCESAPKSQRTRRNTLFQEQKKNENAPSTSHNAASIGK